MRVKARKTLPEILVELRLLRRKLELMSQRLADRIDRLPKDGRHAQTYSKEVSQLSKLLRSIVRLEVGLELLEVRLETAMMLGAITQSLREVVNFVSGVGSQLVAIPEISMGLQEIQEELGSLGQQGVAPPDPALLESVERVTEERLRKYIGSGLQ
ncbi:hypothetical protein HS1genome_0347 [Sulfodiicoccus acidiphilus]|uniref:Uncharacterized protein n=1 Tax=Sulfodiicoccus acidiphilus TaxID=1670455 RepID=A0A348B1A6_9CREN|nr:hypothetical protein [Sulfodiicoccus acidiphilus]BBD71958.1 hypothetical protein HS1genome_0347 [Sulfodiicoccus acidiphilus]GGT91760.1 hypothetical protein GCM10007116_06850 [Sulfodiicoccus acidiphilus]